MAVSGIQRGLRGFWRSLMRAMTGRPRRRRVRAPRNPNRVTREEMKRLFSADLGD